MKPVSLRSRTTAFVASEWDRIAPVRARQIESGADHSAREVLAPAVITLLGHTASILDVGCGTGWLASILSDHTERVVGVDASRASVRLARRAVRKPNVRFVHAPIEQLTKEIPFSGRCREHDIWNSSEPASSAGCNPSAPSARWNSRLHDPSPVLLANLLGILRGAVVRIRCRDRHSGAFPDCLGRDGTSDDPRPSPTAPIFDHAQSSGI
jgi:SAM-dependent methyltransferase